MKKTVIILALTFACSLAVTDGANAQTAASVDTCALSPSDFAKIQVIQNDPTLTYSQELDQELALRKQLLSQTIDCATKDAQALQKTLNAVSANSGGTTIQSQLSGKLDDAVTFYNIESAKLTTAGISATEAIAKEMLAWRAANYIPLQGQTNNFILWTENQNLFQTAQNRSMQTGHVVAFIESVAPAGNLQTSLAAAQSALVYAQSENISAENALAQFQPPDQSLALIQQSLQSLADAYQKFSDLNDLVQKLLPTTSQ